jgi:probable addiction module antidote protein
MSKAKVFDPKNYRDNPTAISQYLTETLEKNDLEILLDAINSVMRAQNVVRLSKTTGIRRRGLYKMFGGDVDPRFGKVLSLFSGLGVRLVVKPLPAKEKPPRPKLGRPPASSRPSRGSGHRDTP